MLPSDDAGRIAASAAYIRDIQARLDKMQELVRRFAGHPQMHRGAAASLSALKDAMSEAKESHDLLLRAMRPSE